MKKSLDNLSKYLEEKNNEDELKNYSIMNSFIITNIINDLSKNNLNNIKKYFKPNTNYIDLINGDISCITNNNYFEFNNNNTLILNTNVSLIYLFIDIYTRNTIKLSLNSFNIICIDNETDNESDDNETDNESDDNESDDDNELNNFVNNLDRYEILDIIKFLLEHGAVLVSVCSENEYNYFILHQILITLKHKNINSMKRISLLIDLFKVVIPYISYGINIQNNNNDTIFHLIKNLLCMDSLYLNKLHDELLRLLILECPTRYINFDINNSWGDRVCNFCTGDSIYKRNEIVYILKLIKLSKKKNRLLLHMGINSKDSYISKIPIELVQTISNLII